MNDLLNEQTENSDMGDELEEIFGDLLSSPPSKMDSNVVTEADTDSQGKVVIEAVTDSQPEAVAEQSLDPQGKVVTEAPPKVDSNEVIEADTDTQAEMVTDQIVETVSKREDEPMTGELLDAVKKKAMGYITTEKTDEFALVEGELKVVKRKVTTKEVPPDMTAVKFLLDESDGEFTDLTEEELKEERRRLIEELLSTSEHQ